VSASAGQANLALTNRRPDFDGTGTEVVDPWAAASATPASWHGRNLDAESHHAQNVHPRAPSTGCQQAAISRALGGSVRRGEDEDLITQRESNRSAGGSRSRPGFGSRGG
jgi:hypothetical protein